MFNNQTFVLSGRGCEKIASMKPIICIGGANVDRKFYAKHEIANGTSNPVKSSRTIGGVARNIAENLGRLGEKVELISVRGSDSEWNEISGASSPFMNLEHVAEIENCINRFLYSSVRQKWRFIHCISRYGYF